MACPMGERDWLATPTSAAIADPRELASWVNEILGYRTEPARDRRKRVALSCQSGSPTRPARGGPEGAERERCSCQSGSPTRPARGGSEGAERERCSCHSGSPHESSSWGTYRNSDTALSELAIRAVIAWRTESGRLLSIRCGDSRHRFRHRVFPRWFRRAGSRTGPAVPRTDGATRKLGLSSRAVHWQ